MHTYTVVVHEDPEGGFWGEFPALPGCYSQGDTIDELKGNIREAIVGVLEVLREQGQQPGSWAPRIAKSRATTRERRTFLAQAVTQTKDGK
jgi:predicted RNase H-like HicB family nuclease